MNRFRPLKFVLYYILAFMMVANVSYAQELYVEKYKLYLMT